MEKYESPRIEKMGNILIGSLKGSTGGNCNNNGNGTYGGKCNGKGNGTEKNISLTSEMKGE